MLKEVKVGQRWLVALNGGHKLIEVTAEAVTEAAVKLDGQWYRRRGVDFVEAVADVASEEPEEQPEPKLGDGWPWVPKKYEGYHSSTVYKTTANAWTAGSADLGQAARFNVYRTEAEAQARVELDKRLAIHAALRQLGGGEDGEFGVRYDAYTAEWIADRFRHIAPGEARFLSEESAQAALDVLLERGVLKHGEWK